MHVSSVRLAALVAACGLAALVTVSSAASAAPIKTGAAATTKAAVVQNINWGQDGFNKGNTGFNSFESAITTANVGSLNYKWSIVSPVVNESCSEQAPPIIDNGRLFVADQGGFAAYNATTGVQEWTVREPGPAEENITPELAASGSTVLAVETDCISQSDPNSSMTAYDAATGAVLWSVGADPAIFTLVIDGGFIATSGAPGGGAETSVYKLSDGSQVWTRGDAAATIALSAGGRMLLADFDGPGSVAVNIATGAQLWTSTNTLDEFAASTDGTKFAATDGSGKVVWINAATGAVLWTHAALSTVCPSLVGCGFAAVDASHIYATGSDFGLTALNTSNGTTAWHVGLSSRLGRPVVAGGVVYVPQAGTTMNLLKASNGTFINGGSLYDGAIGHAVVVNGMLYVTNGRVLDAYAP